MSEADAESAHLYLRVGELIPETLRYAGFVQPVAKRVLDRPGYSLVVERRPVYIPFGRAHRRHPIPILVRDVVRVTEMDPDRHARHQVVSEDLHAGVRQGVTERLRHAEHEWVRLGLLPGLGHQYRSFRGIDGVIVHPQGPFSKPIQTWGKALLQI